MPFEQKYDEATRDAATARVLERWATNPTDRHVFRSVADEFSVGEQSLRAWVAKAAPDAEKPARKTRRPRFSPVVTTQVAPAETPQADVPVEVTAPKTTLSSATPARADVAALEAEVTALRRGNDALKSAMRVLLEA